MGKEKKSKTKGTKKPHKKDKNATIEGNSTEESRETKKRNIRFQIRRQNGSKEAPSTAMSQKNTKGKGKGKGSKQKRNTQDTTIEETQTQNQNPLFKFGETVKNAITFKPATPTELNPPAPAAHKPKTPTICEEDPVAPKPPPRTVVPPGMQAIHPNNNAAPAKLNQGAPVVISPVPGAEMAVNSTVTPNSQLSQTDKWSGEETAKNWLDKADFAKTKSEFESLQCITVDVDTECKKWKANPKLNQSTTDYPALDDHLVTLENVYVHMTQVDVQLPRNVLIGQFPTKGNEEGFWKVVFNKGVTFMEIITDQNLIDFFPLGSGEHVYYGTMFVNNRRVEVIGEDVNRFAIEVLPEGCSNSIICNITVIKNWAVENVHSKQAVVTKEVIEFTNFLSISKDDAALVLSQYGTGRAGYFLALSAAVFKMDKMIEPSIFDIVKFLRVQRPKAVESFKQYVSLYTTLFYYIKRKVGKGDGEKKVSTECNEQIWNKAVHLSNLFTTAMIAENSASSGRSTMTVIK
ncbi:hypothetical protein GCK72_002013 [Caenorhabditis remanei]|uniref:Tyrosine-protein phosphatase domain-containing protein n=1 Tax=Caenorhabditis remanei TaxID=31234 RepID=A0A6A5HRF5_CAERE|nr:hypothetical protein GCK72_002013 [Caenorhabditis remanei]KAF1770195.1 hypothetical protein GCK72_002013 [Caenorhabditis remanei]